jgi:hypothetical protein
VLPPRGLRRGVWQRRPHPSCAALVLLSTARATGLQVTLSPCSVCVSLKQQCLCTTGMTGVTAVIHESIDCIAQDNARWQHRTSRFKRTVAVSTRFRTSKLVIRRCCRCCLRTGSCTV